MIFLRYVSVASAKLAGENAHDSPPGHRFLCSKNPFSSRLNLNAF